MLYTRSTASLSWSTLLSGHLYLRLRAPRGATLVQLTHLMATSNKQKHSVIEPQLMYEYFVTCPSMSTSYCHKIITHWQETIPLFRGSPNFCDCAHLYLPIECFRSLQWSRRKLRVLPCVRANLLAPKRHSLITVCQRSCRKVMFS